MAEHHRIIIVGAGITGLTAATSLAMRDHEVLLLEKNTTCGGLVNSFTRDGFLFDGGIRAVENAGMIKPMLEELQIDLPLLPSKVSLGVEDKIISADTPESLRDYELLLKELYPESTKDVERVIKVIRKFDIYMQVLFGSDSPFFKDAKRDIRYYLSTFILWIIRFLATGAAIMRMRMPMEQFLNGLLENKALIDIISQHFFKKTPAFFAMSYFSLYPDYYYPQGGVGSIPNALRARLTEIGSEVRTGAEVVQLDAHRRSLTDSSGNQYTYDKLIWCADLKHLYRMIAAEEFPESERAGILKEQERILSSRGAESVFTLFLAVDLPPSYFSKISEGHFFYTPSRTGLGELHRADLAAILDGWQQLSRDAFYSWLESFCRLNTYEISLPVLNDSSAAPEGQSGLIASFLFDYELTRRIDEEGWYDEFEKRISEMMIDTLTASVYGALKEHILFSFAASPLSIERNVYSSEGAIVGWSFEQEVPIDAGMLNMKKAILTPMPDLYRAGQWTVSPAGLPTCIMTARMAADLVHTELS
ncbi:MAG: NAD(P)/FAD-dependent oxidoreductase [Spirochaetia bacterium]|nr:NAD(P)/FAD-dependent oxidoreductase [Spirochaetia bacterium]MCF7940701.1 NAD(P)/FAD-dependent oxidoreductase [Spirochaetia bacterium]